MHVNDCRIVVLGGGTSGWMAALALATGLPGSSVTVVESEDLPIVGVGEATFPSIRAFHDIVGVNEAEFLRATNGAPTSWRAILRLARTRQPLLPHVRQLRRHCGGGEDGGVASLRLADGREVAGDLFIDCSGFASLLLGQTLGEPFVDFSHWLPVDRAWACPAERSDAPLTPYTRSTALEAGGSWRIPLRKRTGYGHVFSSRYIDAERAREQLLAQLVGSLPTHEQFLDLVLGKR
ncbi:MAG: tryptophan 7-halogenase [Gammaproteobacteria bacterium]